MRYLLILIFFAFLPKLFGQVAADFDLQAEVCLEEQFQLNNTSTNAASYLWDFCPDDFGQTPTIGSLENNSQLANVNGLRIFSDSLYSSDRYVFVASRNSDQIFKYKLSDSLKTPSALPSTLIPE